MGKSGQKPKGKVKIKWSADFSYALGLFAADGSLSKDGRHIDFTSKDIEQVKNYSKCLGIKVVIGLKDKHDRNRSFRIQFSDVLFYRFLMDIGFTPAKSLTIREIQMPQKYFTDFLRGLFDGDGYSYSYFDPRWKSSFMFYIGFCSASKDFIDWLRSLIYKKWGMGGHVSSSKEKSPCYQLKYSKYEAVELVKKMYYKNDIICLSRKYLKIKESLGIVGAHKGRVFVP